MFVLISRCWRPFENWLLRMPSYEQMQEDARRIGLRICPCSKFLASHGLKIFLLLAVIVIIGLSIGVSSLRKNPASSIKEKGNMSSSSHLSFEGDGSCPRLWAERLLTQVDPGSSFPGYVVTLVCEPGYKAFPEVVRCVRKGLSFTWTHLPVCYTETPPLDRFREVFCTGNRSITSCSMLCENDYVPFDSQPYSCNQSPCPSMTLTREKRNRPPTCLICDEKCEDLQLLETQTRDEGLLEHFNCSSECANVIVSSKGTPSYRNVALQGIYTLVGERHGHPLYQSHSLGKTNYLYYLSQYEWMIGEGYNTSEGTFQAISKESSKLQCPDELKGDDVSMYYFDFTSEEESQGWKNDSGIRFECMRDLAQMRRTFSCPCKVYNIHYESKPVPPDVEYYLGNYSLNLGADKDFLLFSQVYESPVRHGYLHSTDGHFRVWSLQYSYGYGYAVGYSDQEEGPKLCPDDEELSWLWFNTTTLDLNFQYVPDSNLKVKCVEEGQ